MKKYVAGKSDMKHLKEICIAFDVPTVSNEIFNRFNFKKRSSRYASMNIRACMYMMLKFNIKYVLII